MFALQLIHQHGGSKTITAATPAECKERARAISERLKGTFVAATVPYEVQKVYVGHLDVLDVSIPKDMQHALGADIVKLYKHQE